LSAKPEKEIGDVDTERPYGIGEPFCPGISKFSHREAIRARKDMIRRCFSGGARQENGIDGIRHRDLPAIAVFSCSRIESDSDLRKIDPPHP
jgi:hypothetical protein